MIAPAVLPAKVRVGEHTPWGVATEFCPANPAKWVWACATHGIEEFPDQAAFAAHVDEPDHEYPCRIAMCCRADGETHGFRGSDETGGMPATPPSWALRQRPDPRSLEPRPH